MAGSAIQEWTMVGSGDSGAIQESKCVQNDGDRRFRSVIWWNMAGIRDSGVELGGKWPFEIQSYRGYNVPWDGIRGRSRANTVDVTTYVEKSHSWCIMFDLSQSIYVGFKPIRVEI